MLKLLKKLKDRFFNWYILPDKEEDSHPVVDAPVEQVKVDTSHPQYRHGFSDGHRIARALSDDALEAVDLRYRKIIKEHIERTYAAYGLPVDPSADYSDERAVIVQLEIMDDRLKLMGDLFKQNDRYTPSPSNDAGLAKEQAYLHLIEDHIHALRGLLGLKTLASGQVQNFESARNCLTQACKEVKDYGLTLPEIERLAILVEETGETLHRVGKVLRYGYVGRDGFGRVWTNRDDLTLEIGDLSNSINQLQRAGDIDSQQVLARTERKAELLKRWTRYQGDEHGQ